MRDQVHRLECWLRALGAHRQGMGQGCVHCRGLERYVDSFADFLALVWERRGERPRCAACGRPLSILDPSLQAFLKWLEPIRPLLIQDPSLVDFVKQLKRAWADDAQARGDGRRVGGALDDEAHS